MLTHSSSQLVHCRCPNAPHIRSTARARPRRAVLTRAADGAGNVERQLNALASGKSRAPRLKKRPARKVNKPRRAPVTDDDDVNLAGLAGLAGGLGGLGLADEQLTKLLSGDTSEMTEEQLSKLVEGLKGMGDDEGMDDAALEKELEEALERLSPKEMEQLLKDAARLQGGEGDPALDMLAGMLQGDTLDNMSQEELEGLYAELLGAEGPEELQRVLDRTARSGGAGAASSAEERVVKVGDVEVLQGGGSGGAEDGGAAGAEAAEEREGRDAFQKLMQLIEQEDLENDPELADMRSTFKQLKELAGSIDSLTDSELTGKVAATVAELQQQAGQAVGVATTEDGQVDTQWQDALASTLALLLASSYKHYFDRPLLPGQADSEVDGEDAAAELYRRMEASAVCLLYLDYEAGDRQVVDWANQAVGQALDASDSQLEFCAMAELLPGPEAVQEWNKVAAEVWDNEPHSKVLSALQLRVSEGQVATARDVEVFRVNSMGGEAIGLGLRFTRYDKEDGQQVVLAEAQE